MSSDADSAAAAVALSESVYTQAFCALASSVLFIYDAFVTVDREVACFWSTKRAATSLLFFSNRYISMTVYVMVMVSVLYEPFPSDKLAGVNFPPFGCIATDGLTARLDIRPFFAVAHAKQRNGAVVISSRVPLVIADILLIYITCIKLSSREALRGICRKRLSLSGILFRDGIIYFVILFCLNLLHLVFSVTAVASNSTDQSYVPIFTAPISAILVSRFLLELQEANQAVLRLDIDDPLHFSTSPYDSDTPSFVSSLGGFINSDISKDSEDVDLKPHEASCSEGEEEIEVWGSSESPATSSLSV
ncbi:hypothetical protein K466DRAFT_602487 [Polyporus arcularius HHB13444]|uniref:DUF6533 domain-containing protein n=1 Tax=Polyporus arcularius HHB13444 TaxID=1314778 RepID=A0A5C3P3P8_9APHY|nr:hypothetical protein K466DRAFT_602487 [Polyporus arcularius HHB13444]